MNKQSVVLPGNSSKWGSYISKYQPDSSDVLDNMFTANSKNFITDQTGMIDKRQGGVHWNRTNFGNAAKDTFEAVFDSGVRHFLRIGGGILSASTGTGLFDVITSGYSQLGNFEWVTYQDRSYGCNGVNAPQTYDIATSYGGVSYSFTTAKTKIMGAQAPLTSPTSGAYTAGGAVPVGSHRYKVTFEYYDAEESNGSPASAVQTATGGTQTGHLSAIPIGGYGVTARNIYRDNNDGVYLLLDTISDNTTTVYVDTLLIGSTPTPLPLFNDVPPTFTKAALWLDSIFIAPAGETNVVRFSNAGSPDIFDPDNFVTCQSDDIVTALYVYNGKLYVFGLHSYGSIEGNTPDTFYYHNISNLIGCVDNRSIQVRSIVSVPTLWWLSDKGFYYSNGNTVEYGSDFIQDLVNLNLAQVNYSTGKNTQSSFADFSGDTSSPGIDLSTNPGAINTINPKQVYSTTTDWLAGLSLTNIKTSDTPFLEVPTQFNPTLSSGVLSGSAVISGTNLTLPTATGEDNTGATPVFVLAAASGGPGTFKLAQRFFCSQSGTLTSVDAKIASAVSGTGTYTVAILSDALGNPGSAIFTSAAQTVSSTSFATAVIPCSATVFQGNFYWIAFESTNSVGIGLQFATSYFFNNVATPNSTQSFRTSSGWFSNNAVGAFLVGYVVANVEAGTWTSPIYDSGSLAALSASLVQPGSYPVGTAGTTTISASSASNMAGATSQVVSNPNGTTVLTLSGFRYWQISTSVATTNNVNVPVMGTPAVTFSITGTWISRPIDTTTDNTGWGTLSQTGNIPLGTTVALTIATSPDNVTYSSFGLIGSALTQRWAKVKIVLTTDAANITSPSISSITLTWNITAQIQSSAIDTGTTPAGFSTIQWEQTNTTGTVTFYLRTATTSIGLAAASYVQVLNGDFPNLSSLEFVQWKLILTSTADNTPEITSVTVNWFTSSGTAGVRVASIFYNKTYYVSVATTGSTANNTIIQLDQFGNWRIQKDTSIGTFLSYFNTLYFTDGVTDKIFNGFIADTDDGVAIAMDVRTKAWNAQNDLFLKVPRAFKVTGVNTGTTIHAYYSPDRGTTWVEMVNEQGNFGFTTDISLSEFTILFVPQEETLTSGRTLMFRLTSSDVFPCSIMNYTPSFYSRKGRYLSNG